MGLMDDIAGKVTGNPGGQNDLFQAVMGLLGDQKTGGLSGLVKQFSGKGLGDLVNSWVSTGKNLPVTAQQVQQGLGNDTIRDLASKAGLSQDQVASRLTELLPNIVDKLTPDGKLPEGDITAKGMDLLKAMFR